MNESRPLVQRIWDFFDTERSNETYLAQICHRPTPLEAETFIHKLCVLYANENSAQKNIKMANTASVPNRAFDN